MPPAFSTARALGLYLPATAGLNPLARAVHALKYRRRRVVATTLGVMLARCYPFAADAVLVPVPLHPARLRVRGFNQALLLARVVGRHRRLTVVPRALHRGRATAGQFGLGAVARRENLRDAFAVRRPCDVRGRAIVVIDDVMTTGATADACARALLAAGAHRVDVLTIGRTPSPSSDSVESFGTRC
ncbi:MAG TPA: ComF family protein [Candidatus Binatia bacterium]|jgi:ComF family protein|nr:ComF family protein [Candidatus Binatia bacterium]